MGGTAAGWNPDPNGDGIDDYTGLAVGVTPDAQSPTGYSYNGVPTYGNGAIYEGATGDADLGVGGSVANTPGYDFNAAYPSFAQESPEAYMWQQNPEARITTPSMVPLEENPFVQKFKEGRGDPFLSPKDLVKPLAWGQEYVGAPLFGIASGLTEAEQKPIYDDQGNITGYYRDPGMGGLFDIPSAIGQAITHPIREYKQGK